MSVLIAIAAALGLVGLGMLVSPEMGRLRTRMRRRKEAAPPSEAPAPDPSQPPNLRVINGDGGTVVPFRPRRTEMHSAGRPGNPHGQGPDAA